MSRLSVIVGDRDLSSRADGLTISNVDPGGFEMLSIAPNKVEGLQVGAPIEVRYGGEWAWHGLLNEPGERDRGGRSTAQLAGVGHGVALKRNPFPMIYMDRDFAHWGPPSAQRQINNINASYGPQNDSSVAQDPTDGAPALLTRITGAWTATTLAMTEAWYDAGDECRIGYFYFAWKRGGGLNHLDATWSWDVSVDESGTFTSYDISANLRAAGPSSGVIRATTQTRRFACARLYATVAGGASNAAYHLLWTALRVVGTHDLPIVGSADSAYEGLQTSDLVADALRRSGAGFVPLIDEASYIVPHWVSREGKLPETWIDEAAKLVGYHYGTWEPQGLFSTRPTFIYAAPPAKETCVVDRSELEELDVPVVRLDLLFNVARVRYTDVSGLAHVTEVGLPNVFLEEAGIERQTLEVEMGLGTAASAQAYGTFALRLALSTARGGGSAIVPDTVRTPSGARKPACLLKAGRDRIRINGLKLDSMLRADTLALDTFLVRRVETTVGQDGTPQTRVEFDGGADLMEVLNARLAIANVLLGNG